MKKHTDFVFDREGNAVVGAEVYVRKQSDSSLVQLYSDDGVTTTANPTVTDNDGEYSFYTANNTLKQQVYVDAVQQNEISHFQHYDLSVVSTFAWTILDDADAGSVRTTIGLGTIATQAANNVAITGGSITGITDLALADGGTGASLADPNADRIMFWDDSAGAVTWLTLGTNLSITDTTINASGGGGGGAWQLQWAALDGAAPASNFATLDSRNSHPVLDFDATTQESTHFSGVMPADYAGGGITVSIYCALTSATSGTVGWEVSIERIDASSLDIDSDSFATAQTVTATTVPGTSGQILKLSVNISNGANMDSLAAGEAFRMKIARDVANDTATGDAELLRVMMVEQ